MDFLKMVIKSAGINFGVAMLLAALIALAWIPIDAHSPKETDLEPLVLSAFLQTDVVDVFTQIYFSTSLPHANSID